MGIFFDYPVSTSMISSTHTHTLYTPRLDTNEISGRITMAAMGKLVKEKQQHFRELDGKINLPTNTFSHYHASQLSPFPSQKAFG